MITRKTLLKGTFEVLSLQKEEADAAEDLIFTSFLPEDEEERSRELLHYASHHKTYICL